MDRFAELCERIASSADMTRKKRLVAEYLDTLNDEERTIAQRLFSSPRKPLVSGAILTQAVLGLTSFDTEIIRACREAATDTPEMAALLLAGLSRKQPLSLEAAESLHREFGAAIKSSTKKAILTEILTAHRTLTLKYLLRSLQGNLRIGLNAKPVKPAALKTPGEHRILAVITSAEQGRGNLATSLSEYTLGVRCGEQFVNIGKAPGAEREIRPLTRVLRRAAVERFGRVVLVKPEVVLEVAFSGVQKSRHKGGYSLVNPQVIGWLRDKGPDDCDDLDRLKQIYELTNPLAEESPSLLF